MLRDEKHRVKKIVLRWVTANGSDPSGHAAKCGAGFAVAKRSSQPSPARLRPLPPARPARGPEGAAAPHSAPLRPQRPRAGSAACPRPRRGEEREGPVAAGRTGKCGGFIPRWGLNPDTQGKAGCSLLSNFPGSAGGTDLQALRRAAGAKEPCPYSGVEGAPAAPSTPGHSPGAAARTGSWAPALSSGLQAPAPRLGGRPTGQVPLARDQSAAASASPRLQLGLKSGHSEGSKAERAGGSLSGRGFCSLGIPLLPSVRGGSRRGPSAPGAPGQPETPAGPPSASPKIPQDN